MPLFNYECNKCNEMVEKFLHKATDAIEIVCSCGSTDFSRIFGNLHNRTWLNARENLQKRINPEVDRIMKNISKGKDKDFLDICGD